METYKIRETHYLKLNEKLQKLSQKAEKIGVSPPSINILNEEMTPSPQNDKILMKILEIEINSVSIKYDGWEFIGVVQHEKHANILRLIKDMQIPENYKTDSPTCEYCNTSRSRKDTYIVKSENGEFKRVGRNCLKDFTGHKDIEQIAAYFEMLLYFISEIKDDENYAEDEGDYFNSSFSYINPETYLAAVHFVVEKNGWVSISKAKEEGIQSTFQMALGWMIDDDFITYQENEDFAKDAIAYTKEIPEEDRLNNNYLHNVWALSQKDFLEYRDLGLFTSIYSLYAKTQNKNNDKSQYIGSINKRDLFKLQYLETKTIHGDYYNPVKYLIRFQDEIGNIVVWFTENPPFDLILNNFYNVKATVKKHQEYNHVKQTVVNRCVFNFSKNI